MAVILSRKAGSSSSGGGAPSGPAGGSLAGTYPNPTLGADSVGSSQIAANAVGTTEIADGTVTAAKLAAGAAGAMTQLFDSTLGVAAASFDITPIAGTYTLLKGYIQGRTSNGALQNVRARYNNDSGANYNTLWDGGNDSGQVVGEETGQTSMKYGFVPGTDAAAGLNGIVEFTIYNYAGTTFHKYGQAWSYLRYGVTPNREEDLFGTIWASTSAITRITLFPAAGNFVAGSRCSLYGIT